MKNIKSFEDFILLEYITNNQGSNLTLNNNPSQVTFDGGDGASAMSEIEPDKSVVKDVKRKRGNNLKQKHKERKREEEEKSKEEKIMRMSKNLKHSSNFGNNGQGNSPGGGGADYTLQGF